MSLARTYWENTVFVLRDWGQYHPPLSAANWGTIRTSGLRPSVHIEPQFAASRVQDGIAPNLSGLRRYFLIHPHQTHGIPPIQMDPWIKITQAT